MKLTPARYLEAFGGIRFLYPKGNIRIQLTEQSVTKMAAGHKFAFLSGKGRIVYNKMHGDRRLGNLLKGNGLRIFRRAQGIPDMNIRDSGNRHNGSHGRRFDGNLAQSVEFIQLAHLHPFLLFRFMMVYNHDLLAFGDDAVIHFAYADAPHIFIIIDSAHKQLRPCVRIPFGSRNIIQDSVEKRLHILILHCEVQGGASCFGGSEHKRTVQLFVIGIQIHEKLQNLIHNSDGPCLRTVNLIHTYNNGKLQLQSLAQHEFRLGHRAFKSIHHQNNPVHHFKHTFHFTAEIRMPGGINNIDFSSFIRNGRIFGKNGNTSFPLDSIGVHDPLRHILVFPENTALL